MKGSTSLKDGKMAQVHFIFHCIIIIISCSRNATSSSLDGTPRDPTTVVQGTCATLTWTYSLAQGESISKISFGEWDDRWGMKMIVIRVKPNGDIHFRSTYKPRVSWTGTFSSNTTVQLCKVTKEDQKKFGVEIDVYRKTTLKNGIQIKVIEAPTTTPTQSTTTQENSVTSPAEAVPSILNTSAPNQLVVDEGGSITLNCQAGGNPVPRVTWQKNSTILSEGIKSVRYTFRAHLQDEGSFVCVANNTAGQVTYVVDVKVKVLPPTPSILNKETKVQTRNWTLRWAVMSISEPTVTGYTVWHKTLHYDSSKEALLTQIPWQQNNVTETERFLQLEDKSIYKFAITAWNKWGQSPKEVDKMKTIRVDLVQDTQERSIGEKRNLLEQRWYILVGVTVVAFLVLVLLVILIKRRKRIQAKKGDPSSVATPRTPRLLQVNTIMETEAENEDAISLQKNLPFVNLSTDASEYAGDHQVHDLALAHEPNILNLEIEGDGQNEARSILNPSIASGEQFPYQHRITYVTAKSTQEDNDALADNRLLPSIVPRKGRGPTGNSGRLFCQAKTPDSKTMAGGYVPRIYQNDMTGKIPPYYDQRVEQETHADYNSRSAVLKEPQYALVLATNWEVVPEHVNMLHRIGGGFFGEVWKGTMLDVGGETVWTPVAIKMLKANSSKSDYRDLMLELEMLKKLKPHPNIVTFKGCVTKSSIPFEKQSFKPPFVIMELVPFGDLLGYLRRSAELQPGRMSAKQLFDFALDVAHGMAFLAENKLVHRDLAARNVLVGEGLRCKVTDFGMARDLSKINIYVRRSNGLMPLKWMSYESLKMQIYTIESDVWSYGVVLYEIFTLGRVPYDGMTGEEIVEFISRGKRMPRPPSVPVNVYQLMRKCWKKKAELRPLFTSMCTALEEMASGHEQNVNTNDSSKPYANVEARSPCL